MARDFDISRETVYQYLRAQQAAQPRPPEPVG
ncbi:MAG: hypothetical protein ACRD0J_18345 [Acidimicrobiales bacterium]